MKRTRTLLAALLLAPMAAYSADNSNSKALDRQWVALGVRGKLEYKTTPKGDRAGETGWTGRDDRDFADFSANASKSWAWLAGSSDQ